MTENISVHYSGRHAPKGIILPMGLYIGSALFVCFIKIMISFTLEWFYWTEILNSLQIVFISMRTVYIYILGHINCRHVYIYTVWVQICVCMIVFECVVGGCVCLCVFVFVLTCMNSPPPPPSPHTPTPLHPCPIDTHSYVLFVTLHISVPSWHSLFLLNVLMCIQTIFT